MHNQMLNNFYRKKLKFNNNINIEFQVIDWASYDEYDSEDDEEQESSEEFEHPSSDDEPTRKIRNYNIKAYGSTERGNTVCVHIKKFKPYFFIKIPNNWGIRHFKAFISKLKVIVGEYNAKMLCKADIIYRKDFYGFTNNSKFKFAKLTFHNKSGFYSFQRKLGERVIKIHTYGINHNFKDDIYESKIDPMLRFFHEKDISPCGWIKIPAKEYIINRPSKTRCQIDVVIDYDKVISVQKTKISPMIIASFDIECTSEDGTFPNPHRKADEVIQIGTTLHKYGEQECFLKHIVTLKKCDQIEDPKKNTFVESYTTEREVLMAWAKFIENIDPDILTGYNIWGFDWTFLHERSLCKFNNGMGNYSDMFLLKLSRVKNKPAQLKEKELRSAALGDNTLKWIDMEGVVQIDLLKLIQKDHNLDSYKLDAVAHTFMGLNKVDLSPKELFANFRHGSPEKIKEIAVYCIKDCELVNHLIMKLEVIANNIGMGNVCLVPFSYLFMRGQGIKIFSLVAQICREEEFLIKNIDKDSVDQSSYEGAIVFDPKPGIYFEPIAVLDYASLYPSSMISENISHDSIVSAKEYDLKDNLVKEEGNKEYDNLEDYNYSDIQYDVFKLVVENGKEDKNKVGYKVCRFAEHKNGEKALLPRTLKKLLKARKDTRKKIKYQTITKTNGMECYGLLKDKDDLYEVHDVDTEQYTTVDKNDIKDIRDTYNDFEKAVLDGLQLAYKVVCNSLYGQVGAATSSICYKELAASTTATGRKMVTLARDYTLDKFKGSKLIYGDTDSIFISFVDYIKEKYKKEKNITDTDMLKYTIDAGEEAGAYVTSKLKKPQNLEYEKVFWPFCIFSKKRYFGNKYEFSTEKYKQTSMGIVLKRRDNAPIVKDIYSGVIDIILNKKNIEMAKEYFKDEVSKLLKGNVDLDKLIISKTLRSNYVNPMQIAHKVLANRMGERDPGNKPAPSDRIPYCYIDEKNLECDVCSSYVNPTNCKCIDCMKLYCKDHLHNHRATCNKSCRFCKTKVNIELCNTCTALFCGNCMTQHKKKTDKFGRVSYDKCKKRLTNKILQGDIIEYPPYVKENNVKIDYRYYFDHQIQKPVMQIFELVMKNPESIIESIIRKDNNRKSGAQEITKWFGLV
jgi:DNA polymerase delta subunit 1